MYSTDAGQDKRLEAIQQKLSELGGILCELSAQMKQIADMRQGDLEKLTRADRDGNTGLFLAPEGKKKPARSKPVPRTKGRKQGFRFAQYLEFSSLDEFLKFKKLEPITPEEIAAVDWNELEKQLSMCPVEDG